MGSEGCVGPVRDRDMRVKVVVPGVVVVPRSATASAALADAQGSEFAMQGGEELGYVQGGVKKV